MLQNNIEILWSSLNSTITVKEYYQYPPAPSQYETNFSAGSIIYNKNYIDNYIDP